VRRLPDTIVAVRFNAIAGFVMIDGDLPLLPDACDVPGVGCGRRSKLDGCVRLPESAHACGLKMA